jgi:hypothetical protein
MRMTRSPEEEGPFAAAVSAAFRYITLSVLQLAAAYIAVLPSSAFATILSPGSGLLEDLDLHGLILTVLLLGGTHI